GDQAGSGNPQAPYQHVFELSPVAFALVDQRLRVVGLNRRFRAMMGMAAPGATGRFMHELFPVGESDLTAAVITAARGLPGVMTTVLLRVGEPEAAVMASCLTIHGDTPETHVLIVLREVEGRSAAPGVDEPPNAPAANTAASTAVLADAPGRQAAADANDTPTPDDGSSQAAAAPTPDRSAVRNARARERRLAAVG